ncbi:hypothetical protein Fcan01_24920 [Folsomia candida]|uniref:Uncharacterized protein n=1 Tax=Folsomia candida TaxID=158441 RepID=A0A226D5A7_FOLCA|nr:hypothetical protein Fcan01_24920 [Folsomia candida]
MIEKVNGKTVLETGMGGNSQKVQVQGPKSVFVKEDGKTVVIYCVIWPLFNFNSSSFIFPKAANCSVNTRRIAPGAFGAAVPQPLHFKEASVFVKTHTGIASTDSSYLSVNQIQAPFETSLVLVDIGKAKIWSRIVHGRTNKSWVALT